jgi:hypothetical protein
MPNRADFRKFLAPLVAGILLSGLAACSSDSQRLMDTQVRSGDRPECQTREGRSAGNPASGVETAADPCGNLGTMPVITSDNVKH